MKRAVKRKMLPKIFKDPDSTSYKVTHNFSWNKIQNDSLHVPTYVLKCKLTKYKTNLQYTNPNFPKIFRRYLGDYSALKPWKGAEESREVEEKLKVPINTRRHDTCATFDDVTGTCGVSPTK
jgi:hypothetical protein